MYQNINIIFIKICTKNQLSKIYEHFLQQLACRIFYIGFPNDVR
jgi:hypothetical protein